MGPGELENHFWPRGNKSVLRSSHISSRKRENKHPVPGGDRQLIGFMKDCQAPSILFDQKSVFKSKKGEEDVAGILTETQKYEGAELP